jgi:hypothetical protein
MAALSSISTLFGLPQDATQRSQLQRFNFTRRKADAMKFALILLVLIASTVLNAQSGWKTVKDETGSCQISVPPTWTPLSQPGFVNSPQHIATVVTSGMNFKPFDALTLKMLGIDKLFENSATRIFYVTKPGGNPLHVGYHVEVPGKAHSSCIAEIALPPNTLEDDAKKIALSLSRTP